MRQETRRARGMSVVIPAAVFALVFVARWITIGGGADDHWSLWTATTFLKGDLPLRDFTDAGAPLYWAISALGQWVFGYRVVGEVLVGSTLVATALTIGFLLSWRASDSLVVAAVLSAIVVLLVSAGELYSYPKTFVYEDSARASIRARARFRPRRLDSPCDRR